MFKRIQALLQGGADGAAADQERGADELHLAAAALLVESASMDGHFDAAERAVIAGLLRDRFTLSAAEAEELIEAGAEAVGKAGELYGFTRVIKDRFGPEDKVRMIEMLWEVAYADGQLHDYEAGLVRKVAGLLYVPDRDSGAARKRVLARLAATAAQD